MGIALMFVVFVWATITGDATPPDTSPVVERLRALFDQDLAEFAQLSGDSLLYCDPALCGEDLRDNLHTFSQLTGRGGKSGYYPIADSLLPDCQKELVGEPVTILWGEGMARGVFASVGYFFGVCDEWSRCEITPTDSTFSLPGWYEPALILREGVKPPQSIRSYDHLSVSGEQFRSFEDSIGEIFAKVPSSPLCQPEIAEVHFDYFIASNSTNQDTLFATAHGGQCDYIGRWQAVYLLTKTDNDWSWIPVIDVRKGPWVFTISCSFDLNSDGFPEFLVWEKTFASLYSLVNGRFVWIVSSREHPC